MASKNKVVSRGFQGVSKTFQGVSKVSTGNRKIKMIPLSTLLPYGKNARTHSDDQIEQITASIREFGWTNPVLVDGENGIIAGHARVEAAKRLGMADVPCIVLDGLSEAQKRAYVLADNKLALNAGWDEELLRLELQDLKELDFNLDLIGFTAEELADVMLGPDVDQKEYDESAADDVQLVTCPKCGHSFPK
jgi:ParB-like chromosome segregation protein Spo0J